MSGWPKRCQLAHAFLWGYNGKRLKLAQLLGQLGIFQIPHLAANDGVDMEGGVILGQLRRHADALVERHPHVRVVAV